MSEMKFYRLDAILSKTLKVPSDEQSLHTIISRFLYVWFTSDNKDDSIVFSQL